MQVLYKVLDAVANMEDTETDEQEEKLLRAILERFGEFETTNTADT